MGNKPSSSKGGNDSTKSGASTGLRSKMDYNFGSAMTIDEYRQKVDQARQLYKSGYQVNKTVKPSDHDEKHDHEEVDDFDQYHELVRCLSLNHPKISSFYCENSQSGIISQLIQQYSGNYYIKLIYTIDRHDPILSKYDFGQISCITNPINSDIYITDTVSIYKLALALFATTNDDDDLIYHSKQLDKIYSIVNSKGKRNKNHKNNNIYKDYSFMINREIFIIFPFQVVIMIMMKSVTLNNMENNNHNNKKKKKKQIKKAKEK